jgi:antitoxin (DNA-binding transcriptional repressor) of toxin-antitoxin stability system
LPNGITRLPLLRRLLDRVERGEEAVLAKHGSPVARVVPLDRRGLTLGSGKDDSNVNRKVLVKGEWWKPMTDEESDAFIEGR